MFKHEKQLFHPVAVDGPNPQYAALLQEQLGGANGEMKSAMQYLLGLNPGLINASGYSWTADYVTVTGDLCADLLSNIASEQRAKVVYEYLYRQIKDKKVQETIDFLLNREEAHNALFREAFNKVQDSGSDQSFGVTEDSRLYFNLSNPSPGNSFGDTKANPPSFGNPNQ